MFSTSPLSCIAEIMSKGKAWGKHKSCLAQIDFFRALTTWKMSSWSARKKLKPHERCSSMQRLKNHDINFKLKSLRLKVNSVYLHTNSYAFNYTFSCWWETKHSFECRKVRLCHNNVQAEQHLNATFIKSVLVAFF